MKSINTRTSLSLAFCFYLIVGLAQTTQGRAEEYYTYRDPDGKLVISNKLPPPGSKIIKQQTLPEPTDIPIQQVQERDDMSPNGHTEGSPRPSKDQ